MRWKIFSCSFSFISPQNDFAEHLPSSSPYYFMDNQYNWWWWSRQNIWKKEYDFYVPNQTPRPGCAIHCHRNYHDKLIRNKLSWQIELGKNTHPLVMHHFKCQLPSEVSSPTHQNLLLPDRPSSTTLLVLHFCHQPYRDHASFFHCTRLQALWKWNLCIIHLSVQNLFSLPHNSDRCAVNVYGVKFTDLT